MEEGMEMGSRAAAKKQLTGFGKAARRKRIFARLREGWAYDEIAREEGITARRARQIVSEALQRREVDDGAEPMRCCNCRGSSRRSGRRGKRPFG